MSLQPGTRFGPYEIVSVIGAGGMGEVYRARDTRLDRTVALKVLTGALAADSESRMRFEHEARAIAALNDPHICTLHDIGVHGDLDYLVFEYLDGETLSDRLRRSPALTVEEALAIAIQIGDALDRAHSAGIVHHDLKPGNVMLVRRGTGSGASAMNDVKLLDFGLAARTSAARPQALDATLSVTVAPTMAVQRRQGSQGPPSGSTSGFTGTVQYMAPERLEDDPGDHRADIFAFGCVFYEMLAGRKAFEGATVLTAIAAIKSSEPPPAPSVQSAHPSLDHVLRRCLEKDREARWQNIRDVTGELRWMLGRPMPAAGGAAPPAAAGLSRAARAAMALVLVLGAAAAVAGVLALRGRGPAPNSPALRFEVATAPTDDPAMALSPGTDGASYPFFAPDGRVIGFFANDKLKRIDLAGGTPIVVADAPNARGGAWNAGGVMLFAPGVQAPIMRVPDRGGSAESVTQINAGSGLAHRLPQFMPDGKQFMFSSTLGGPDSNGVYLGSLDKTPPVRLLPDETGGRFVPPDKLLAISRGALQAYSFDAASGTVQDQPVLLAQGLSALALRPPRLRRQTRVCWHTAPARRSAGSSCG